jgi:hypothetical protein
VLILPAGTGTARAVVAPAGALAGTVSLRKSPSTTKRRIEMTKPTAPSEGKEGVKKG